MVIEFSKSPLYEKSWIHWNLTYVTHKTDLIWIHRDFIHINLEYWFIFLRYSYWKWEFIFPCYLGLLTVKFSLLQIWLWNIYWLLVLRFVHPIFSPFGFWYFGHFSCVIFFPSCPSCLAKCKKDAQEETGIVERGTT